ncbi:lachesin-like isoform X2 [Euwallacea fornicatus]|uniref:lachesin-like isoform X2 n=1 Tax=Euwallacea fornicatus TaxID=995702 RepID=UPI0033905314
MGARFQTHRACPWSILQLMLMSCYFSGYTAFQPEFAEPIKNMSIPIGRDATFQCVVHHLGGYRVGWVKADTKAIQAIHDHVITHNPRISVSHNDHSTWNLHIKSVQEEDRGQYMCQINTDPMKSQVGSLDVSVPPDFTEETSGDLGVPEGGTVKLTCRAKGHPVPYVQWRREDGKDIIIREPAGTKTKVTSYQGETLQLWKISRTEMGAYMCIASNGVPPTVSKRVMVNVHFHPVISVPNQLVGAPLGTDVTLECYVEAFPKSINYWVRDTEIPGPTKTTYTVPMDEEDYNDQLGSAERDQEDDFGNNVLDKDKPSGLSTQESLGKLNSLERSNHVADSGAICQRAYVRLFLVAWAWWIKQQM